MVEARFDVRAYAGSPQGSLRADLHVADYASMRPQIVDVLTYLRRRQSGITGWLSVVLVTPTHKESRITAFLSSWAFEQHWVSDALAAMAGADEATADTRSRFALMLERSKPLTEAIVANVHGSALTSVHMAERLLDSWIVDVMLGRLSVTAGDAALAADIATVRAVLARQERFFAETAGEWLKESPRSARLVRRRLRRHAWPLGAEREAAGTTADVFRTLFGDDRAWARALDDRVDALPGLAGLHLFSKSAANPGRPPLRTRKSRAKQFGAARSIRRKGASASR